MSLLITRLLERCHRCPESELRMSTRQRQTPYPPGEPNGEDWLIEKTLIDGIDQRRRYGRGLSNRLKGQTEDAVDRFVCEEIGNVRG